MNFELGKEYIVKVSKEGIIPIEEFKSDRFYDKDHDDLDFLTDEEKIVVINNVFDKIRAEIESMDFDFGDYYDHTDEIIEMVCKAINKYKTERNSEE